MSTADFRNSEIDPPVDGFLHTPTDPSGDGLVLTHGAGGNCNSPLLTALAQVFCTAGIFVLRCNLPFRQLHPQGPPRRGSAARDQEGLRSALTSLRKYATGRLFLGGHSYGGRQASILAASDSRVADGLLLLSYPLHAPQRPLDMRTAHFPDLRISALFVHGTRDSFGSISQMTTALTLISAHTSLLPIDGAGHELLSARTREQLPGGILQAFREFFAPTASASRS